MILVEMCTVTVTDLSVGDVCVTALTQDPVMTESCLLSSGLVTNCLTKCKYAPKRDGFCGGRCSPTLYTCTSLFVSKCPNASTWIPIHFFIYIQPSYPVFEILGANTFQVPFQINLTGLRFPGPFPRRFISYRSTQHALRLSLPVPPNTNTMHDTFVFVRARKRC